MDRIYGRQIIPEINQSGPKEKKYWGWIQTVISSENFTLKRIFMNSGSQSSMEYHIHKNESYFIEKGKLKLGLRVGRAENKSVILEKGDIYHIPAGLMHMRIAIEDTLILEWSNGDNDLDSNIVEDGKTYKFLESDS